MGLRQWLFMRRFKDWPETRQCPLTLTVSPPKVNRMEFGSPLSMARAFGRPTGGFAATQETELQFAQHGLVLGFGRDGLESIDLYFTPQAHIPDISPAEAMLQVGPEELALSAATTFEQVTDLLGKPEVNEVIHGGERSLSYFPEDKYELVMEWNSVGELEEVTLWVR
ncbi:hypothetical protein KQI84_02680 [bacterium]|nr:hypothetical protein [bacterium]